MQNLMSVHCLRKIILDSKGAIKDWLEMQMQSLYPVSTHETLLSGGVEMEQMTLEKFEQACEIVSKVTQETKLIYSEYFSNQTGNRVWLKPENMQCTGAYKI